MVKTNSLGILIPRSEEDLKYSPEINRVIKDGVPVKKGTVLTEEWLTRKRSYYEELMNIFSAYPDLFLDKIQNPNMKTELFLYQRKLLRAFMRYKDVYVTAPRAFSKSFLTILGLFLQCVFIPGTKRFIAAPFKTQSASIAKEKIFELYERWPLLQKEVEGCELSATPGNFGKDYVEVRFKNGSILQVVGTGDSGRGGRKHGQILKFLLSRTTLYIFYF